MQRVEIEWIDSGLARSDGWEERSDLMKKMTISRRVITSGIYMGEDDEKIVVGLTHDQVDDTWFSAFAVYKPNIVSVHTLRVRDEVKPDEEGRYFPNDGQ